MAGDNKTKKALSEEAGKYLLDMSKLIFGGVFLVSIMNLDVDKRSLLVLGAASVFSDCNLRLYSTL